MLFQVFVVGTLCTNCYLLACEKTRRALVVDPGGHGEQVLRFIEQEALTLELIVNTHGHIDHISANGYLQRKTGARVCIHPKDSGLLFRLLQGLNHRERTIFVGEGDVLAVGEEVRLKVLYTPGHTPGGISLVGEGFVFTGDTLFAGSIGRTDLPGGSYHTLLRSIKEKLLSLPDEFVVYPGHGPFSTIGEEKQNNPFLK